MLVAGFEAFTFAVLAQPSFVLDLDKLAPTINMPRQIPTFRERRCTCSVAQLRNAQVGHDTRSECRNQLWQPDCYFINRQGEVVQGVQIQQRNFCGAVGGFALLAILALTAHASSVVTLVWDPSLDPRVAGYAIWYGTTSGVYPTRVDVGNRTMVTISNLVIGQTYYFVATAYTADGLESPPSNEVGYTVPGLLSVSHTKARGLAMVQFAGYPGETVAVQASEDLKNWTTLYQLQPSVSQVIKIVDPASAYLPKRFYRLMGPNVGARKLSLTQFLASALPRLSFAATPGAVVEIQASDDRVHWTTLHRFVVTSNQPLEFFDPTLTDIPMRFYRTAVGGMPAAETTYIGPDALRCTVLTGKEISVIKFWGQAGETVTVQASGDMINWTSLYELHITANKLIEIADPASINSQQRFYRLLGTNVSSRRLELRRYHKSNMAKISFVAPPGDVVQFQASENLVDWITLYRVKVQTNQWIEIIDPESATLPRRFYRLAPAQ